MQFFTDPVIHEYLSTGCLHGRHDYCNSMLGYQGSKRPGQCKFCGAQCICKCHQIGTPDGLDTPRPTAH